MCSVQCKLNNEDNIIIICIYISPNNSVQNIIDFLHFHLLPYTKSGSRILKKDYDKIPMIVSGDFNINFQSERAQPLITFLKDELYLDMSNNQMEATTRGGTTIDAVFSRFLERIESNVFVSYFSYHKPLITIIKNNEIQT